MAPYFVVRLSGERDERFVNGSTSDGGPHSKRCAIRTYVAVSRIVESKGLPRVIVGHAVEIMMLVVHVPATRIGGGR